MMFSSYKKEDDTSSHLVTSSNVTDLTVVTVISISPIKSVE